MKNLQKSETKKAMKTVGDCWVRRNQTVPDKDDECNEVLTVGSQETFRRRLFETIAEANEVIIFSSFLFADNDMKELLLKAVERGVRVYGITASEERLYTDDDANDFDLQMVDEHKKMLNNISGLITLRTASHFHGKFIIADPKSNPRGYLSTANFNLALRKSVELGVELDKQAVNELYKWFIYVFWNESEHELRDENVLSSVPAPPANVHPPADADMGTGVWATTNSTGSLKSRILQIVRNAEKELQVATYGMDVDHEVFRAILKKAESGTEVTVYTRPRPAVAEPVRQLIRAGATVYGHDKLHAKVILNENDGVVTSANLQSKGLDSGFEAGVSLNDSTYIEVNSVFKRWRQEFPWHALCQLDINDFTGEYCEIDKPLKESVQKVADE